MASEKRALRRRTRRRYGEELKAEVMAGCDAPDAWVAQVAMSHGMNANVVRLCCIFGLRIGSFRLSCGETDRA